MPGTKPTAIIDIGSNSVRLVVYSAAERVPTPIFNEKVMAGLGSALAETGTITAESWSRAITALKRYKLLLRHMGVRQAKVIATAAARDAANGPEFVHAIEQIGFDCRVVSAEEEAWLAGEGVLSAIPDADGIVGDLGGGSLEFVEVKEGRAGRGISLPLGVLRVEPNGAGEKAARDILQAALKDSGLGERGRGRNFYMVGGSWRALARIDMLSSGYPLPITHQHSMAPGRAAELRALLASADLRSVKAIAPARLARSPAAAMLLEQIARLLQPRALIASSFGIREGLLYSALKEPVRRLDPLLEALADAGGGDRRFGQHGEMLDAWIAPLFDDPPPLARIRLAACLLADVAWQTNPDFRADRGVEMALHGNWVAVTAAERVLMAQALSSNFGRDKLPDPALATLCTAEQLERAREWGLAMRLGQRLCGGVGSALEGTRLELAGAALRLVTTRRQQPLVGGAVERRLQRLAEALGRTPEFVVL